MNKYTSIHENSYSLGMSLSIEALKHSPKEVKEIILSSKAIKNEQLAYLLKLCQENNLKPNYDDYLIEKLSLKENCYCIAVFKKFYRELVSHQHLVLYKFNDFGELGTIFRSAVSFNFKDIILVDCSLDYFDPRVVRASMGAIFHLNIKSYQNLDNYLKEFPNQRIIPFVSESNNELKQLNVEDNFSLLISQNYYDLDYKFNDSYYLSHENLQEISLSIRSSIILNFVYNLLSSKS